jgi:hypothetical protein
MGIDKEYLAAIKTELKEYLADEHNKYYGIELSVTPVTAIVEALEALGIQDEEKVEMPVMVAREVNNV